MFKKTPDYAHDFYIVRKSAYSRNKTADSAHAQLNSDAGAACLDNLVDNHFVGERIDFYSDIRTFPCFQSFCKRNLFVYHLKYAVLKTVRRNKKAVRFINSFAKQKRLEHGGGISSNPRIGGNERQVCVQKRRFFVVVSCSNLSDVGKSVFRVARNQAQFGMDFVIAQTVDNPASCFLKPSRHFNIVFLVKTRAKLHKNNNFLSVFRRLNQRVDYLAFVGNAVKCHLYGNDA